MTSNLKDKLQLFLKKLEEKRGAIKLAALFLRVDLLDESAVERWDLVISASWVEEDKIDLLTEDIFSEMIKTIGGSEIASFLQKLVLLKNDAVFVHDITQKLGVISSYTENQVFSVPNSDVVVRKMITFISNPHQISNAQSGA